MAPICPAIAPTTMPKLSPSPARIGISRAVTSTALRAKRDSSSRSRNPGVMWATRMPVTHSSVNSSGTAACARALRSRFAAMLAALAARERVQDHAVLDDEPGGVGDVALHHLPGHRQGDGENGLEQHGAEHDVEQRGTPHRAAADQQ